MLPACLVCPLACLPACCLFPHLGCPDHQALAHGCRKLSVPAASLSTPAPQAVDLCANRCRLLHQPVLPSLLPAASTRASSHPALRPAPCCVLVPEASAHPASTCASLSEPANTCRHDVPTSCRPLLPSAEPPCRVLLASAEPVRPVAYPLRPACRATSPSGPNHVHPWLKPLHPNSFLALIPNSNI